MTDTLAPDTKDVKAKRIPWSGSAGKKKRKKLPNCF